MDGSTGMRWLYLDGKPLEICTLKERQERFDREIGPDIDKLSEEDIKLMRKAYLLEDGEG